MYRMDKLTTGAAYGASAGSILNGMLIRCLSAWTSTWEKWPQ